jgi:hypothetical protein
MNVPFTPLDGKSSSANGRQFLIQGGPARSGQFFDPLLYGETIAVIHEDTPSIKVWTPLCRVMAFAPMLYEVAKQMIKSHDAEDGDSKLIYQHAQELLDRVNINGKDVISNGCTGHLSMKRSTSNENKLHCHLVEYDINQKEIPRMTVFANQDSQLANLFLNAREIYFGISYIVYYHNKFGLDRETPWHMIRNPIENIDANQLQVSLSSC